MPQSRASDPNELDDGERTTASITSISSTGKRNPFDDDDIDKEHNDTTTTNGDDGLVSVESGRVKRFIREMRSKGKGISCRNADTVAEEQSEYISKDKSFQIKILFDHLKQIQPPLQIHLRSLLQTIAHRRCALFYKKNNTSNTRGANN